MAKSKIFQQNQKAKKAGLTNIDLARIRESARKEAEAKVAEMKAEVDREIARVKEEDMRNAFLCMLAIPLNVLVHDYWPKSAKKTAPKFINDVLSLYDSFQGGVLEPQELMDLLYEYAGVEITEEWLKRSNM